MITIWNVMCKEKNFNVTFKCYLYILAGKLKFLILYALEDIKKFIKKKKKIICKSKIKIKGNF